MLDTEYQKKSVVKTLANMFLTVKRISQMCEHQDKKKWWCMVNHLSNN